MIYRVSIIQDGAGFLPSTEPGRGDCEGSFGAGACSWRAQTAHFFQREQNGSWERFPRKSADVQAELPHVGKIPQVNMYDFVNVSCSFSLEPIH